MAKYSFQLKLAAVQDYIQGVGGYKFLAEKYGVTNKSQIREWINNYREYGKEGLLRSRANKSYSVQFKLDAIELYQTSEMSYLEVANYLRITRPSLIASWTKKFRDEGIKGLSKLKGRPSKMAKKRVVKSVHSNETATEQERIKELEKQVRSLQIENAFLKELRKLRKQEERKQMKLSRKSSSASEDNSN